MAALASLAFANQSPIDALATSTTGEATEPQAAALLEEGRALNVAGDHAALKANLGEAVAPLGIASQ